MSANPSTELQDRPSAGDAFEEGYFEEVYGAAYDRRNPRYKHRSYLRELARHKDQGKLLDLGCAYGAFLREAVSRFECTGSDISRHAVAIAQQRVPAARITASNLLDVETDERFDVVTCLDVLEHVPDLDGALAKVRRLLLPGGALMLVVPVYDTWVGRLVERIDKDPTHVHKWSRYAWLEKLAGAGYRVAAWKGILRCYLGGPVYLHFPNTVFRGHSPAIMVFATPE